VRRVAALGSRGLALLLALGLVACARPAPRPPQPPPAEEYPQPRAPYGQATEKEARDLERAWEALRAGQTVAAEKTYRKLAARKPGLLAARTGLGYVHLQAGRLDEAAQAFEGVLAQRADDLSALTGAAATAAKKGDPAGAIAFLQRATQAAPDNALVRRRLSEVRVQLTERHVADARAALERGDTGQAITTYREALQDAPEVAGLRLELAELLVTSGDVAGAVEALEGDPSGDRQVLLRLGDLLAGQQQHQRALEVYRRLLERDPRDEDALRAARAAREQLELLQMPPEYRRIRTAESITRADLSALIGVKVTALGRVSGGAGKVAVDISGSWAREHILRVLSYDIMTVYPNHTFQPAATVRRGELALAVQRILDLLRYPTASAPVFSDMSRSNLHHYAAARVVAAGLMDTTPEGAFQAWRPVSGREANDVIEGLARLVGP
jgi:tetratricopeptide (TPR) repeat protein